MAAGGNNFGFSGDDIKCNAKYANILIPTAKPIKT
jgi:hypothetical protein